ncbi:MAG: hypothetical protein RIB60_04515 [Phycisphaerales bacterium]
MDAAGPNPEREPDPAAPAALDERRFPCASCGGRLTFAPGTDTLTCPYCRAVNEIAGDHTEILELDFRAHLEKLAERAESIDQIVSHCDTCGANVEMPDNVTSHACPFCGSDVVATGRSSKLIKPGAVVPFKVERSVARSAYQSWIKKRWFAPSDLKSKSRLEARLAGIYLPYWTYDSKTSTDYTGQRGEHYYVTVPYTTSVNGKTVTRTRRERRTRWYPVSGRVHNVFDDLLVPASTSLPADLVEDAGPWKLDELRLYDDAYLAGFRSESYAVDLPTGFVAAEGLMQPTIDATIRADIGGDEQRISTKAMHHSAITFKHVLLPVWVSAYRYKQKTYQVIVNAQTGEVVGDRPYSVWKILSLTLAVAAAVAAFIIAVNLLRGG